MIKDMRDREVIDSERRLLAAVRNPYVSRAAATPCSGTRIGDLLDVASWTTGVGGPGRDPWIIEEGEGHDGKASRTD